MRIIHQCQISLCFSALDTASEYQVQEALERVMKGRSVITIAHRISTIQNSGNYVLYV